MTSDLAKNADLLTVISISPHCGILGKVVAPLFPGEAENLGPKLSFLSFKFPGFLLVTKENQPRSNAEEDSPRSWWPAHLEDSCQFHHLLFIPLADVSLFLGFTLKTQISPWKWEPIKPPNWKARKLSSVLGSREAVNHRGWEWAPKSQPAWVWNPVLPFTNRVDSLMPLYLSPLTYNVEIIIVPTSWAVVKIKWANPCEVLRLVPGTLE